MPNTYQDWNEDILRGNMKKITTEIKVFQYFYPYTVALVGAKSKERTNYMSCAWHSALSFSPPLFGVLISEKRLTHRVVSDAGEFTVNFIGAEKAKLSAQMGRTSGFDCDKIETYGIKLTPAKIISSPVLEDAYAAFECKLIDIRSYGDHDLFVGQVLAVHEEENSYSGEGVLRSDHLKPLLYLGSDFYTTTASTLPEQVLP
jgi:flavin reductase (DIM6/NTAB) family NADH-FMN oxidoreductase RutF